MKIVSKRAYNFVHGEIVTEKGELVRKVINQITVKPSVYPQEVPDWVAHDELFDIAQRDGNLTVVQNAIIN